LVLDGNDIKNERAALLARALITNTTLTQLSLDDNYAETEVTNAIAAATRENQEIKKQKQYQAILKMHLN
jgi:hypothetical protein|tara:strand:+ start:216 stop:425 length:210 start_codon:yes stop_codon:yes gene_type:complete